MVEPRDLAEPALPGRGGITDSEKAYLRGKLLTLIDQDDTQARILPHFCRLQRPPLGASRSYMHDPCSPGPAGMRRLMCVTCSAGRAVQTLLAKLPPTACGLCAQIAVQVAVTFAKVARTDYLRHWPSLLGDLVARINGPGGPAALQARRAFLMLHHILKELSSRRLAADQRTFAEARAGAAWSVRCIA